MISRIAVLVAIYLSMMALGYGQIIGGIQGIAPGIGAAGGSGGGGGGGSCVGAADFSDGCAIAVFGR